MLFNNKYCVSQKIIYIISMKSATLIYLLLLWKGVVAIYTLPLDIETGCERDIPKDDQLCPS